MDDSGVSLGMNLALSFGSVVVKMQQPDPDLPESDRNGNISHDWPVSVHRPGYGVDEDAAIVLGPQKMEKEDPGYGDTSDAASAQQNAIEDVRSLAGFSQTQSEEQEATSEEEFIVMYNDDEREQTQRRMEVAGDPSGSTTVTSTRPERRGSNAQSSGDMFEDNDEEGNGLSPLVTMVDNFLASDEAEGTGEINVTDTSPVKSLSLNDGEVPTENGAILSDEQRSVDEIQVVEEGVEDDEEGEIIKEFAQNRHGTSSEMFLSQMHFFGGRTWARGRGRRGHGRGRDITNIALKLIETDQTEADSEHSNSLDGVDQMRKLTDNVRSGRGKLSGRSNPIFSLRKSLRIPESKETENLSSVVKYSRKESARGRGRPPGSRGSKQHFMKSKSKSEIPLASDNADDIDYESNDEDTLAAIQASLEDMKKNNNKTDDDDNSTKDDSTTEKNGDSEHDNSVDSDEQVDGSKTGDKAKKNGGYVKKGDKTGQSEIYKKTAKDKKAGSLKENAKKGESSKKTDDQKRASKAGGCKLQTSSKKLKGKSSGNTKQAKEIANTSEPVEEVEYESNDEDTQAAIKASLEELEKEKQRQKERELEQQKTDEKQEKKGKVNKGKKSVTAATKQTKRETSPVASTSKASSFQFKSKKKGRGFRRGDRHSSRLSAETNASTSHGDVSPHSGDTSPTDRTRQKVNDISMKLENRIYKSVNHELVKEKKHSSDVSHFENVVDEFLQVEKSPNGISVSSNIGLKGKCKQGMKRKSRQDSCNSVDVDVDSDDETIESDSRAMSHSSSNRFHSDTSPQVKLLKLDPALERSSSRGSSHSVSVASSSSKKRVNKTSDDELDIGPSRSKVARKSLDYRSGSSQRSESSIVDIKSTVRRRTQAGSSQQSDNRNSVKEIKPVLDSSGLPASEGKDDSLTKSIGGMMSYLFGDKLSEECPNGFVVNVRLEVEKKKDDDDGTSGSNSSGTCCKTQKPELCPCLQRVPDAKLASVLKERVENRRDLTVGAKGALLAAILSFMQELEAASTTL